MSHSPIGRSKWSAYVLSWERVSAFGRPKPVPFKVEFTCWAWTRDEARELLDRQARRQGYGLGGIQGLQCVEGYERVGHTQVLLILPGAEPRATHGLKHAQAEAVKWLMSDGRYAPVAFDQLSPMLLRVSMAGVEPVFILTQET